MYNVSQIATNKKVNKSIVIKPVKEIRENHKNIQSKDTKKSQKKGKIKELK